MAFQKIDDGAFEGAGGEEYSLDAGLLQDVQGNGREAQQVRGQGAAWVVDYRNPPRLCALERHTLPFLVWLPPRLTTLRLRVRGVADGTLGVTLGVAVTRADWLSRPVPADVTTQVVASSIEGTVTLDVPEATLREVGAGWALIHLTILSEQDAGQPVTPTGGGAVPGHLEEIRRLDLLFQNPSAEFGNSIPSAAVEVRTYDPSTEVPADATWRDGNLTARQVVVAAEGAQSRLFFWPAAEDPNLALNDPTGADVAWLIGLGWLKIFSVEFLALTFDELADAGTTLNALAPPSAPQGQRLYMEGEALWVERVRWHHVGPQSDPSQTDLSDSAKGWWGASTSPPVSPVNVLRRLAGSSWETIGAAVVGRDDEYTDVDETDKRRTAVEALVLFAISSFDEPLDFNISLRLAFETTGSLADGVEGEELGQTVTSALFDRGNLRASDGGVALAYPALNVWGTGFTSAPMLHALRGIYSCARWPSYGWRTARLSALDDNLSTGGRRCLLELRQVDEDASGGHPSASSASRYLHVASWSVVSVPSVDGRAVGKA